MVLIIDGPQGVGKNTVAECIKSKSENEDLEYNVIVYDVDTEFEKYIKSNRLDFDNLQYFIGIRPQICKTFLSELSEIIDKYIDCDELLIIPMVLSTTLSKEILYDKYKNVANYKHVILSASDECLEQRIKGDLSRTEYTDGIDEAKESAKFIHDNYEDDCIDTTCFTSDITADKIIHYYKTVSRKT